MQYILFHYNQRLRNRGKGRWGKEGGVRQRNTLTHKQRKGVTKEEGCYRNISNKFEVKSPSGALHSLSRHFTTILKHVSDPNLTPQSIIANSFLTLLFNFRLSNCKNILNNSNLSLVPAISWWIRMFVLDICNLVSTLWPQYVLVSNKCIITKIFVKHVVIYSQEK